VFKTFDSNTPVSVPLARCSLGLSCYCQRTTQQLLRYTHRQRASLLPPLDVIANVQFHAQEGAGTFIPTMHSAFDDPQCEDNATPRESVECRICAPSHLHLASTCLPAITFLAIKRCCALTRCRAWCLTLSLLPTAKGGLRPSGQSENRVGGGENALESQALASQRAKLWTQASPRSRRHTTPVTPIALSALITLISLVALITITLEATRALVGSTHSLPRTCNRGIRVRQEAVQCRP
jgi:hypothetical protein